MGSATSKHRGGQQRERTYSLTSQTALFTLLKCTGSCDLQTYAHFQFNGHFFPVQTLIAETEGELSLTSLLGHVLNPGIRIATVQNLPYSSFSVLEGS